MNSNQNGDTADHADRRLDQRLTTRLEAVIEDATHGTLLFTTSGFSRTGAFLRRRDETTPLPAVGGTIKIVFSWPLDTQMAPVRVEAKVVRQTADGIGVRFQISS